MFRIEDLFNTVNIRHVWIFLTDKCNLNCEYCFFKYRTNRLTLSFEKLKILLDSLPKNKRHFFLISGGEPLLEWKLVKKVIRYIKQNFLNFSTFQIQTNGMFMNTEVIRFLKNNAVAVEHGVDGKFLSNFRHRKGTTKENYKKLLKSINLVLKYKLKIDPTMAVHPGEIGEMYENFLYLVSLGLYNIEVHPTFWEAWEEKHIPLFAEEYKRIINYELENKKWAVSKYYDLDEGFGLDLIILPDGNVLPNWTLLILPPDLKEKYSFLRINERDISVNKERLNFYLRIYTDFYKAQKRTYREFSNLNTEIFLKDLKDKQAAKHFESYKRLCHKIKIIDQQAIIKRWKIERTPFKLN